MTEPSRGIAVIGMAALAKGSGPSDLPGVDPGRLRRMDRFGRNGFLAGSLALLDGGFTRSAEPDPRAGVVFGTAYGCRDSVTEHALLVANADELRPGVFAQTVHNSVSGELAIEWRLGGVSETILTGRTAGLEALTMAARQIAAGAADRVVAGGAEGLHDTMREAFAEENARLGTRGVSLQPEEAAGALYLVREDLVSPERIRARWREGASFFEPDPAEARLRLLSFADRHAAGEEGARILLASSDLEETFAGETGVEAAGDAERFGASGPHVLVQALRDGRPGIQIVLVRDPDGPCAAVALSVSGVPR